MQKICTGCKKELTTNDFSPKGKGKLHPKCKTCRRDLATIDYTRHKERYKASAKKHLPKYKTRNAEFIAKHKSKCGCIRCGENDFVALDAHHIDPKGKEHNLNHLRKMSYSIETIEKELSKCVILCANCHRKFHAGRFTIDEKTSVCTEVIII